ncbi:MAG: GTP-binding protein [Chitinophagales bacterium]
MSLEIALERIQEAKKNNARSLDLSDLDLKKIPLEIGVLTNLTVLDLSRNQIGEIGGLDALANLTVLSLSRNQISEIGGLDALANLTRLDLHNNQISEIPPSLLKLKQAIYWKLPSENDYKEGIYLKNNPLTTPPPEIVKKGNSAIQTFLEELQYTKPLNEVKVILVGQGASGKTSLVKRLLKQDFDAKEKQTHGINILKKSFRTKGESLQVNFWDFGGQEIMHATHQFFLTKRCLYVLVLDSRKDAKAEYWLKYIENFGGNAPVLVVLNKMDENPSFEVNREFLSKKYPAIQNYYKISCHNEEGIPALKKDLLKQLWNLELRNTPFPTHWWKVKDYFQKMKKDYIN